MDKTKDIRFYDWILDRAVFKGEGSGESPLIADLTRLDRDSSNTHRIVNCS